MKPIIIIPHKTTEENIKRLTNAGYVPIVTDDPDKIRLLLPEDQINGGHLLMSALHAITSSQLTLPKERFVDELYSRLCEDEQRRSSQ